MSKSVDESWLTTSKSEALLNNRQLEMYRSHRRQQLSWMLHYGKKPEVEEGYARSTVRNRSKRLDLFYRWVWKQENKYTEQIETRHADAFLKHLYPQEHTDDYKQTIQKALQMLFKWQKHDRGKDVDWEPEITYTQRGLPASRDPLTKEERSKLREEVLSHGHIPRYSNLSVADRKKWKEYIAKQTGRDVQDISNSNWDEAGGWKIPSMFWTALDAGLRPKEVERAKVSWVESDLHMLRIPVEDAVKNDLQWDVSLKERTVEILDNWIEEREYYSRYDDTDLLWLTERGNPYSTQSLKYWFDKMVDEAGISSKGRDLSWYSIRHSLGTEMMKEMGAGAAAAQLRHKTLRSTLRYSRPTAEDRKDALDNIG